MTATHAFAGLLLLSSALIAPSSLLGGVARGT